MSSTETPPQAAQAVAPQTLKAWSNLQRAMDITVPAILAQAAAVRQATLRLL